MFAIELFFLTAVTFLLILPNSCVRADYVLKYDMDKDSWTGPRGIPSQLSVYAAAHGGWGYTAPEHVTAGRYSDGVKYVQLKMQRYITNPGLKNWFGPGSYGCRFHYASGGSTSFSTGRVQWTEEWTGAAKVKTSMMHWFDAVPGAKWPDAGERDLLEQWEAVTGCHGTMHKGPAVNGHHPMQIRPYANINLSKRTTFRATFTPTIATVEVQKSNRTWVEVGKWTDPAYWQPNRAYHIEGALAYSANGAEPNDPKRGNAIRRISQLKVWSSKSSLRAEVPETNSRTFQAWYVVLPVVAVAMLAAVALTIAVVLLRHRQKQARETSDLRAALNPSSDA